MQCGAALALGGKPLPRYNQLVIEMRTPEGALSKHEMLMCTPERAAILMHGISPHVLRDLYARDIAAMVRAHQHVRGGITPQLRASADWLARHEPIRVLDEEGTSVLALRKSGRLK
jgi:hypothetical protein